jgi:hypothetical protein
MSINQPWLIYIVTALYILECIRLFYNGQIGFGIMFLGYSLANIGIILAMMVKM